MLLRPMVPPHRGAAAWGQDSGNCSSFFLKGKVTVLRLWAYIMPAKTRDAARARRACGNPFWQKEDINLTLPNHYDFNFVYKSSLRLWFYAVWLHDLHGSHWQDSSSSWPPRHSLENRFSLSWRLQVAGPACHGWSPDQPTTMALPGWVPVPPITGSAVWQAPTASSLTHAHQQSGECIVCILHFQFNVLHILHILYHIRDM